MNQVPIGVLLITKKVVKKSLYCSFKLCNILHIFNIRFWRCKRTYASLCIGHVLISFIRLFPPSLCSQCNGADQVNITITCTNIFLSIVTLYQTNFYCLQQYLLDVSNHLKAVKNYAFNETDCLTRLRGAAKSWTFYCKYKFLRGIETMWPFVFKGTTLENISRGYPILYWNCSTGYSAFRHMTSRPWHSSEKYLFVFWSCQNILRNILSSSSQYLLASRTNSLETFLVPFDTF